MGFPLALLALVAPSVMALDPARDVDQYTRDVWRISNGLPMDTVLSALQTSDGYLWLGTTEGLVRFDGVQFVTFDRASAPGLTSDRCLDLFEDSRKRLWISTDDGLALLEKGRFRTYSTKDGLPSQEINAVREDRDGTLWVATGAGLARWKPDAVAARLTTKEGLPSDTIHSLLIDSKGNLWIGTEAGLCRRARDGALVSLASRGGLFASGVRALLEDSRGNVWIGTRGSGLGKLSGDALTSYSKADGMTSDNVQALCEDRDGNVWAGTSGGGVLRIRDGVFSVLGVKEGLGSAFVRTLCEDREGSLWIGMRGGGLARLRDRNILSFGVAQGLGHDYMMGIATTEDGTTWIGTGGGLSSLRDGKVTNYTTKDGLPDDVVYSLAPAPDGSLWVGTHRGLTHRIGGSFRTPPAAAKLGGDVYAIALDGEQGVWFATASGLHHLQGETLRTLTTKDGLTNHIVNTILQAPEGLYIGTREGVGGLHLLAHGVFTLFTTKQGLADNLVLTLARDAGGSLWIGTAKGLSRLKGGRITSYTTRHGLISDTVTNLLVDGEKLWVGSQKGLLSVDRKEFDEIDSGKRSRLVPVTYGASDGMASTECNGDFQPSAWKDTRGRLWFPTTRGAAMIDPATLRTNRVKPAVHIEQLFADGHPLVRGASFEAPPGDGRLEVRYTATSFLVPARVRFRYRLEGFDPGWIDAGTQRVATYTNIPPGRYRFRVKACNDSGVWNEDGDAAPIVLAPRFYQTLWFRALAGAAGLAFVWLLIDTRRRALEAEKAVLSERNRIAQEIHDSLAQGLSGISLQLEAAKRLAGRDESASGDALRGCLDRAADGAKESLEEARRSVHALAPASLREDDLAAALGALAERSSGSGTEIHVQVCGEAHVLPAVTSLHLLRIAQEAMANAVRHGRAKRIDMTLTFEAAFISLRVTDDGAGFAVPSSGRSASPRGFGLLSMERRARQLGATLSVVSAPGGGTEVSVRCRTRRSFWSRLR